MLKLFKMLQFVLTICLLLPSLNTVHGFLGNQCNIYDLRSEQCGQLEICDENTNSCQCAPGNRKVDNSCEKAEAEPIVDSETGPPNNSALKNNENNSLLTGILMFLFVVVNIVVVIYVLKKYNVIYWVRSKVHSFRQSNYDEFMIGQDIDDDPPLR